MENPLLKNSCGKSIKLFGLAAVASGKLLNGPHLSSMFLTIHQSRPLFDRRTPRVSPSSSFFLPWAGHRIQSRARAPASRSGSRLPPPPRPFAVETYTRPHPPLLGGGAGRAAWVAGGLGVLRGGRGGRSGRRRGGARQVGEKGGGGRRGKENEPLCI